MTLATTFVQEADAAQIAWKATTTALDEAARANGSYRDCDRDVCIPRAFATQNLLPDARGAVDYFAAAAIPWHDSVDGGPSNHLRDSQVQCVNALAPFMSEPDALAEAFGAEIVTGSLATLRRPGRARLRTWRSNGSARATRCASGATASGRAAPRTRAPTRPSVTSSPTAARVVSLIEWKYTERYLGDHGELRTSSTSQVTRDARYRPLYEDPECPLRHGVIPYEDFYVEPVYQLFRLSLLAWRLEAAGVADCVRVLYCAPGPQPRVVGVAEPRVAPRDGRRPPRRVVAADAATSRSLRDLRHRRARRARRPDERRVQGPLRPHGAWLTNCPTPRAH